jgi:hypothetical protein
MITSRRKLLYHLNSRWIYGKIVGGPSARSWPLLTLLRTSRCCTPPSSSCKWRQFHSSLASTTATMRSDQVGLLIRDLVRYIDKMRSAHYHDHQCRTYPPSPPRILRTRALTSLLASERQSHGRSLTTDTGPRWCCRHSSSDTDGCTAARSAQGRWPRQG